MAAGVEMLRCTQHDRVGGAFPPRMGKAIAPCAASSKCHPSHRVILSEAKDLLQGGVEMLRGVYTERSERAQHDKDVVLSRRSLGLCH